MHIPQDKRLFLCNLEEMQQPTPSPPFLVYQEQGDPQRVNGVLLPKGGYGDRISGSITKPYPKDPHLSDLLPLHTRGILRRGQQEEVPHILDHTLAPRPVQTIEPPCLKFHRLKEESQIKALKGVSHKRKGLNHQFNNPRRTSIDGQPASQIEREADFHHLGRDLP